MKHLLIISVLFCASCAAAADIKDADLAGTWYPADKVALESMLEGYLNRAKPEKIEGQVLGIISPHAGYQFSGPVAAYGFKAVRDLGVKTVVIIGFSHRKFFDGISVYAAGAWRTPLGAVRIDERLASEMMSKDRRVRFEPGLFDSENSIEMQVPFVQMTFKNASIVPVAFGTQEYSDAQILASVLAQVLKNRKDVLVVASTDMSHYHPYEEANSIDDRTLGLLNRMRGKDLFDETRIGRCELCGIMPVTALLLTAEKLGFTGIRILKYANSGDTSGNKGQVVGYVSAAIYRPQTADQKQQAKEKEGERRMLNETQRKRLLEIARESMTAYVRNGERKHFKEGDPLLNQEMGAFVTLREAGELRGCIGNMVGRGPLYQTVAAMAIEAATGDPRFRPVSAGELDRIDIEISVLSPMKRAASYKDVTIPGDGVLIKRGFASGVYLPQVATETGWNREKFLTSLCGDKAGIDPDAWKDPDTQIYTFKAEIFGERGEEI